MDENELAQMDDTSIEQNDVGMFNAFKRMFGGGTEQASSKPEVLNPFAEPQRQGQVNEQRQERQERQEPQGTASNNNDAFNKYVLSQNFADGYDFTDFDANDPQKMTQLVNTIGQNAYSKAMNDTARVLQSQLNNAFSKYDSALEDKINSISKSHLFNDKASKELPLMQDSSTAPIMQSILQGFVKQGYSEAEAITMTKKFAAQMAGKITGDDKDTEREAKRNNLDKLFG